MKILVYGINFFPELTGIGKYTGELSQWLIKAGHQISVVTAPPYYPEWKVAHGYSSWKYRSECIDGIKILRCPLWIPRRLSGIGRVLHLLSFALSSLPTMLLQSIGRPDVVLTIEPALFCAPTAWLTGLLSGAKKWLHVQDFEVDAAFELGFIKSHVLQRLVIKLECWLMKRFDRVSTISKMMTNRLAQKGVAGDRQVYFPNWVDTQETTMLDRPSLLRNELGLPEKQIVTLYSGNMGEKQGLEIMIEAARHYRNEPRITFVMCGHGVAYKRLRLLAKDVPNILWLPLQPLERLNELLNLADIHLLPQRADVADLVMPSKLTGILASGRPMIVTAHQGTELWQVASEYGIAVEPGNVNAFVDAIRTLMNNAAQREGLGKAAREYAITQLDKNIVLAKFEHELKNLVENKG